MDPYVSAVTTDLPRAFAAFTRSVVSAPVLIWTKWMSDGDSMLWLTDTKGRRIGVPVDKIAYVEVAADAGGRKVGFGAS